MLPVQSLAERRDIWTATSTHVSNVAHGSIKLRSAPIATRGKEPRLRLKARVLIAAVMSVGLVFVVPAHAEAPMNFKMFMKPKQYAQLKVNQTWNDPNQFTCLVHLWTKESNWNPKSQNKIRVSGLRAGGIPQILGLSPKLHPNKQIDRGLKYIKHRYGSPCQAWKFWLRQSMKGVGWY